MLGTLRTILLGALGAALLGACDEVVEPGSDPEGVRFGYSGARTGTFASEGGAVLGQDGLPEFETFAVAQRDSIGGLLLGSYRRTGEAQGDLFILQVRGTATDTYTCGAVVGSPGCYGHLYLGLRTGEIPATADAIYGISTGQVVLSRVSDARVEGSFQLTLRDIDDASQTITVDDGTIDVPLVEGIFNASFRCLAVRLEQGPDAPCE